MVTIQCNMRVLKFIVLVEQSVFIIIGRGTLVWSGLGWPIAGR